VKGEMERQIVRHPMMITHIDDDYLRGERAWSPLLMKQGRVMKEKIRGRV